MLNENYSKSIVPDQLKLWDAQHSIRGYSGIEAYALRDKPNNSAIIFNSYLNQTPSNILEIGCANGRDARYWASLGHIVICADFSSVALSQLHEIAQEQGVRHYLQPVLHDISTGKLPDIGDIPIHGFYSRSSLHVDDETMISIAREINERVAPSSPILIEGKGAQDHKIKRSIPVAENLVVDHFENGHLRRVWTKNFLTKICNIFKWDIQSLEKIEEKYNGNTMNFLRLVARKN